MKFIMEGAAQQCPAAIAVLTEDVLLDPKIANQKLEKFRLEIDRVEMINGEKVVYIKESKNNLICG